MTAYLDSCSWRREDSTCLAVLPSFPVSIACITTAIVLWFVQLIDSAVIDFFAVDISAFPPPITAKYLMSWVENYGGAIAAAALSAIGKIGSWSNVFDEVFWVIKIIFDEVWISISGGTRMVASRKEMMFRGAMLSFFVFNTLMATVIENDFLCTSWRLFGNYGLKRHI